MQAKIKDRSQKNSLIFLAVIDFPFSALQWVTRFKCISYNR
ncbi:MULTISPECIES: hypothetical protein [Proteus]|nr:MULTISPECIES: hypothetical protein [Proteus]AWF41676.1 hypothetical protein CSC16_3121 [Proteus mirabilis]KXC00824.1 hypothetical protein HMPREF3203_01681 [Proteus mirabilis]MCU9572925.1 hypothetical protein [Proteus mirabilis]MDC5928504.1 hypothetical protein [Proteus mirabilis]MDC6009993.1 hypothetical protein [Proteus mirabilis]